MTRKKPPLGVRRTPPGGASRSAAARRPVRLRWWWLGAAVGAAILVAAAWVAFRTPPPAPAAGLAPQRDNILLITLDTTRADHLGAYGYTRARTRHMDRLASEGVRFDWAFSAAPITLPAHATLLTGLYPFEHGVRNNGNFYLADRFETLATILSKHGYQTAAFVSSFVLDRRYGLARGFDTYDDRMQGAQPQVVSLEAERRGDWTAAVLGEWLQQRASTTGAGRADRPFFAWLHLYDPHEPYAPPQPFRGAFLDSPYDGEIAFDDAIVASIVDKLRQLNLVEGTIIAIVGDHGESLGDHGEETHSMFVYDAAIRIPLILWRPGRLPAGRVVPEVVRISDVAPTLLDLVGAPALATRHGRSLVPLVLGKPTSEPPPAYAESYLPQFYMNWAPLTMLRDERWKLIDAPRPELYDVSRDPGERDNVYASQPRTAEAMQQALARLTGGSEGTMTAGGLDREAIEKLAALGYVAAAGADVQPRGADGARKDPKDVIAVFNRLRRANSAVRDRRFDAALPILHEVLADDPDNAFATLALGSAYMGMGRNRDAIAQYRRYLALVPTSAYAHQWMAICHVRLDEPDRALEEAGAALAIDPRFADARILRGGILASRGQYDASIAEIRAAVETDPAKAAVRLDLAKVLGEAGRADQAREQYETILRLQADYAPALTGLGALLAQSGQLADAERVLRRSLEVDVSQADARFNLARVLERQGQRAEARTEYERVAASPAASVAVRAAARERVRALQP